MRQHCWVLKLSVRGLSVVFVFPYVEASDLELLNCLVSFLPSSGIVGMIYGVLRRNPGLCACLASMLSGYIPSASFQRS